MNAALIEGKYIDAARWDDFVSRSPQGNIYHCHAYLSNLIPGWQAVVLKEREQIVAAFPVRYGSFMLDRLPFWASWAYALKLKLQV